MFGHNDDQSQPPANVNDTSEPAAGAPALPSEPPSAPSPIQAWDHPAAPANDQAAPSTPPPAPVLGSPLPPHPGPGNASDPADIASPKPGDPNGHDLLDLKQKALTQLSPIVGHLDQTPEEKFRTLMMMIQASDDQSLLQEAYDTAQKITDEKTKAQALLDVVNEINYFTQHKN